MRSDPDVASRFAEAGFVTVPGVLTRQEAHRMRALLQSAIETEHNKWQHAPGYQDHWMVHNLMLHGDPFLALLENRLLHRWLGTLFADSCVLYAYTSSSLPPGGSNFSRRIHVDCGRIVPGFITNLGVTLALDDFTEQNGATEILPGSQWRSEAPSEEEFCKGAVPLHLRAGEAAIFNARCWHRGGLNRTAAPRHAVTMNVCRSFMRQRFDYPRLVPPELVNRLGPTGRRFLGFNVRVPASLDEYYVPADQRLYLPGQG
jgi:ectoine hydroxylase-related dioxygenase (phytanoyl-CoA dioxygenase family)